MTEVKKVIGKTKVGLVISVVLVVILAVSNVWFFMRVESLHSQVDTLETDKNALQSQVTSVQDEFVTLNASYVTLDADYNEMDLRFNQLNANYANLTEHFGFLREDYTTLNETYTALLGVFNQLEENYQALTNNFSALSQNYTTLVSNYDALTNDYNTLSGNYSTLLSVHQALQEQYFALKTLYEQLQTDYETLENTYDTLLEQYGTMLELWNNPLEYVVTPTWDDVITWLETDQTNATSYDPEKFLCGDFSIMLIQHAKAMHWRMLFTVLEFDYYDENPTGIERHHGYHAHAFVSIFTTEDIVYIEPQTDYTWYVYHSGDPETHVEFSDWEFIDFGEEWFGHIFIQYYTRMEANVAPIQNSSASVEAGLPH